MLRNLLITSVFSAGLLAGVPAGKQPPAQKGYQLAQCFGCHRDFRIRAVLSEKKTEAILKVRTGQMPPGVSLTLTEKTQLIRQIQETVK